MREKKKKERERLLQFNQALSESVFNWKREGWSFLFLSFFFLVRKKGNFFFLVQPTYLRTARASTLPFPFSTSIFFINFFLPYTLPTRFCGCTSLFSFLFFSISSNYLFGTTRSIACSEKEEDGRKVERKKERKKEGRRERKDWEGRNNQYREQAPFNSGCGVWIILYGTHTEETQR